MTSQLRERTARGARATVAALSGVALSLLVFAAACKQPGAEPDDGEQRADRSQRAKQIASEEAAQRAPTKPTSPVAAPGAAEPPPRASEVPQRLSPGEDLPTPKQLPVAEDFQAETAAAIVKGNYHSELDSLESEVKSDGK